LGKDGNAVEIGHLTIDFEGRLKCGCGKKGHWAEILFDAAKDRDKLSLRLVEEIGVLNAIGFANVINAYDPSVISVGGAVTLKNTKLILSPIRRNVENYVLNRVPKIIATPLGEDVGIFGAVAAVLKFGSQSAQSRNN